MAQSGEEEFAGDGGQAAQGEPAQPDAVFEAGVQSFDVRRAALVQARPSGVRSRWLLAWAGVASPGGGPSAGRLQASLSMAWRLPVAMSRSGPGALMFSSLW